MATFWRRSFLRTRVARRILGLFLLCAVLPVSGLAILGYRFVARQLEEDARISLRAQSKTAGLMLLDRLASLAAILEHTAPASASGPSVAEPELPSSASLYASRFQALAVEDSTGAITSLVGDLSPHPPLSATQTALLAEGGVALAIGRGRGAPSVFLVRALDPSIGARLWGEVNANSVWGSDQGRNPAPPGTFMCLATSDAIAISCPDAGALTTVLRPDDGAMITFFHRGEPYLAGRWMIFLGRMYGAPSWTVMLSRPAAEVYAPLRILRTTFILGLLLALTLVFVLAHVHLRRTMGPLEALDAGTRRLTAGNFTEPVQVASGDEFEVLATSFNRMAGELARQFGTQQALQEVGRAALEAEGPETVLSALFSRSAVLVGEGELAVALCRPDDDGRWLVIRAAEHRAGGVPHAARPEPWEIEELRAHAGGFTVKAEEGRRSYFAPERPDAAPTVIVLPLVRHGVLGGALLLERAVPNDGEAEALAQVRRNADPIGVALVNTQLHGQLEALTWGALTALARAIDAVSPWTAGHSERVTLGALEIGRRLGLAEHDLDLLHRGGLLHDVGKVGIPAALLDKPGKLTGEEYEIIKQHPSIGAKILAPIAAFHPVLPLVLRHHELLDGSGYPGHLVGDEIPLLVRVLTVSDVFDALTSDRPYRPAWPAERAIALLRSEAVVHFDPLVVEALAAAVADGWKPVSPGLTLELPIPRTSSRYSLWPEAEPARPSRPVTPTLPAGVTIP